MKMFQAVAGPGIAQEEPPRGDHHALAIGGMGLHPRLAFFQLPVAGLADADEARSLRFVERGQARRPRLVRRQRRRMIGAVEGDGLAGIGIGRDHRPARIKPRVPDFRQFAGEFGTRPVGRACGALFAHFIGDDPWRGRQHDERNHQPGRRQVQQRDFPYPHRGDRDQRQRHQEEQRDAPVGLDVDMEHQGAERRPDRHHGLDDPDIERLRQCSRSALAPRDQNGNGVKRTRPPAPARSRRAPPATPAARDYARHSRARDRGSARGR